ncbi:FeoA family protein [Desulfuromonas acetoxidans]|uniref:FeoA family protein n=1 Tax=Desulfuromonas acetoxidans TaxID=891 RepID=UPI00292F0719|nr:FeoA family protein [Desulfuromonas acetoxidans]
MSASIRLLQVHDKATITSVTAPGEMGRRLRDMGLVPGTEIEIVGRAPLKDPVALRLRGFTLTLRNNEADYIHVAKKDSN